MIEWLLYLLFTAQDFYTRPEHSDLLVTKNDLPSASWPLQVLAQGS